MNRFPNRAGDHHENDAILYAELQAAGITTLGEAEGKEPFYLADIIRKMSGEVKTGVQGVLHHWVFKRNWYYWVATGPGLDIDTAMNLWQQMGHDVRANGDCACRSPYMWNQGFATTSYHIDTPEGLLYFANVLKAQRKIAELKYASLPEELS